MRKLAPVQLLSCLVIFFFLGFGINFNFSAVVFSLILTHRIFDNWLDPFIFDTKLTRALLTPFFYLLILQCVALFVWLISRNFPLDMAAQVCGLFLLLLYIISYRYNKGGKPGQISGSRRPIINSSDYVSFGIAVTITCAVALLPIYAGGLSNKSSLLNLVNGNVDDAAHIALLNDRLHFNRGILYHADIAGQTRNPAPYPIGWHSANAVVIKATYPSIKPGTQTLGAYIVSKVFWFFILVFVFVKTIFVFLKFFRNDEKQPLSSMPWINEKED